MSTEALTLRNLSDGRAALERARALGEIAEIKRIGDVAAAARRFAEAQGMSEDAKRYAAEIELDAKRYLGELLVKQEKNTGSRGRGKPRKLGGSPAAPPNPVAQPPTLAQLGVSKKLSAEAQKILTIPQEDYDEFKATSPTDTINTRKALALARSHERNQKLKVTGTAKGAYRVIYADPPWHYGSQGLDEYGPAGRHYRTLTVPEICELQVEGKTVQKLAQREAVLFLWVTSPQLPGGLAVIDAWGFAYKTSFVWDKVKHNYGHYNSVRHEFLLVATKGSCLPDVKTLHDSVVTLERNQEHSSKPAHFRGLIDGLYTFGNRIELFARDQPEGWDVWGSE